MSTATATAAPHQHSEIGRLSFLRVLRSEWIKLVTLRSTFWTLVGVLVLIVGLSALLSAVVPEASVLEQQAASAQAGSAFVTRAATAGLTFAPLVIAVLGVLAISGEFSTGMIRSSFAAVPHRFPVFAGKAIVLFVVSGLVGLISLTASWAIAVPLLTSKGYKGDFFSDSTLWSILGGAAFLGLVAVFALGVGAIVKASAGGIAITLGVLFLLPIIVALLEALLPAQTWIRDWSHYLLSEGGNGMAGLGNGTLEPWQNILTVAIWAAVSFIVGAILLQRRDA